MLCDYCKLILLPCIYRIMMLSVLKHTKNPVKFWFLKNFLSPNFKVQQPSIAYFDFKFKIFLGFYSTHGQRVWVWVRTCTIQMAPLVTTADSKTTDHLGVRCNGSNLYTRFMPCRYKILFLDVLFPLSVKKIIFVDADQVN